MRFQVRSHVPVFLEPIAFADIVINLFVFFFLSFGLFATFDAHNRGSISVDLPKGGQTLKMNQESPEILTLKQNGTLFLGSRQIVLHELKQVVEHSLSRMRTKQIVLRADKAVRLEKVIPVLDRLRETSAQSVSVETERIKN